MGVRERGGADDRAVLREVAQPSPQSPQSPQAVAGVGLEDVPEAHAPVPHMVHQISSAPSARCTVWQGTMCGPATHSRESCCRKVLERYYEGTTKALKP